MDHISHRDTFEAESRRFLSVLVDVDPATPVPSCPSWAVADLLWHLGEVHAFWAQVVGDLLADPADVTGPTRPADADLHAFATARRDELLAAFDRRSPEDRCWSWADRDGDVRWALRRHAHEALVHRVDAELAAGAQVTRPVTGVAADGVDELVHEFLVGVPAWAVWHPDGVAVALEVRAAGGSGSRYVLELGRMTGTSPSSGRSHDLAAAELRQDTAAADVEVVGDAWALDRWLWGRGGLDGLDVTGDADVLDRFRALVQDATQ